MDFHHRQVATIQGPGKQSEWLAIAERAKPSIARLRKSRTIDLDTFPGKVVKVGKVDVEPEV